MAIVGPLVAATHVMPPPTLLHRIHKFFTKPKSKIRNPKSSLGPEIAADPLRSALRAAHDGCELTERTAKDFLAPREDFQERPGNSHRISAA
jgi:hypothetical protein